MAWNMSALRKLSAIYIAAASAYAVAIACSYNPVLAVNAKNAGAEAIQLGGELAIALNNHVVQPGWAMAKVETADFSRQIAEMTKPAPVPTRAAQAKPHG